MEERRKEKRQRRDAGETGSGRQAGKSAGQGKAHSPDLAEKIEGGRESDQEIRGDGERADGRGIIGERNHHGEGERRVVRGAGGAEFPFHPALLVPRQRLPQGGELRSVVPQEPEPRGDASRGGAGSEDPLAGRALEQGDSRQLEIEKALYCDGGRGGSRNGQSTGDRNDHGNRTRQDGFGSDHGLQTRTGKAGNPSRYRLGDGR